ncbi:hypothetical protein FOA52_000035 [Chlamydomonas sp. UWO 241]|nr:hypothetical protein FOA52_000035 [Chlamydomonas sp. UWO 241]
MQEGAADDGVTRLQVVVRVRPVQPHELSHEAAVSCAPEGDRVQVALPNRSNGKELLPGTTRAGAKSFRFDACLPGSTEQEELFNTCGMQELVESALDGYSVTIFAFGQTGSGKTHSMIGPRLAQGGGGSGPDGTASEADDGVMPRCVRAAFSAIKERAEEAEFCVSVSVLELYNEAVTDLLGPGGDKGKELKVRQDARDGFLVDGLTSTSCSSAPAALKAIGRALSLRHTRSHRLNNYSSRSHCLVTLVFSSREKGGRGGAQGGVRRYGKLVLVDLAGSERLKETGNTEREAVRETGCINKSLFTLGQVLAALCARSSGASGHVPYRDSKLTQLLWDGLRAPYAEETLNTLHFASMANRIKASPVMLLDPADQLVMELRTTIKQLQEENRALAASLQQLFAGGDVGDVLGSLPERLREMAVGRGTPPMTAPPGGASPKPTTTSTRQLASSSGPLRARAGRGARTDPGSPAAGSPWRDARGSAELLRTPPGANVLRVAPPSGGSGRGSGGANPAGRMPSPLSRSGGGSGSPAPARRLSAPEAQASLGPGSPMASRRSISNSKSSSSHRPPHSPGGARGYANPLLTSSASPSLPAPRHLQYGSPAAAASTASEFPELAALEAEFQNHLGGLGAGGSGAGSGPGGGASARGGAAHATDRGRAGAAAAAAAAASAASPSPRAGGPLGEVKALKWAARNAWFGSDRAMTEFAYSMHDMLVDRERMDPSSDVYFMELERRTASKFPECWAALARQGGGKAEGSSRGQQAPPEKLAPSAFPAAEPSAAAAFSRALRVSLKEPLPGAADGVTGSAGLTGTQLPPGATLHGFRNLNTATAAGAVPAAGPGTSAAAAGDAGAPGSRNPNANAAGAGASASGGAALPWSAAALSRAAAASARGGGGSGAAAEHRSPGGGAGAHSRIPAAPTSPGVSGSARTGGSLRAASPGTATAGGGLTSSPFKLSTAAASGEDGAEGSAPSPFSLHAINPLPRGYHAAQQQQQQQQRQRAAAAMPSASELAHGSYNMAAMQAEYLRQRMLVLGELRAAKDQAEVERARIMAKIGKVLGSSRYRR